MCFENESKVTCFSYKFAALLKLDFPEGLNRMILVVMKEMFTLKSGEIINKGRILIR